MLTAAGAGGSFPPGRDVFVASQPAAGLRDARLADSAAAGRQILAEAAKRITCRIGQAAFATRHNLAYGLTSQASKGGYPAGEGGWGNAADQ